MKKNKKKWNFHLALHEHVYKFFFALYIPTHNKHKNNNSQRERCTVKWIWDGSNWSAFLEVIKKMNFWACLRIKTFLWLIKVQSWSKRTLKYLVYCRSMKKTRIDLSIHPNINLRIQPQNFTIHHASYCPIHSLISLLHPSISLMSCFHPPNFFIHQPIHSRK